MTVCRRVDQPVDCPPRPRWNRLGLKAMTLVEVVLAMALFALVFGSVLHGLIQGNRYGAWIVYDTAAARSAEQRFEQTMNARWEPNAVPPIDEVVSNNFPSLVVSLDERGLVRGTNSVFITPLPNATSPRYKVVEVRVIWSLMGRGRFTNSLISIRAPDQ